MAERDVAHLGNALTALGLEDKFLSNGELSNFPLVERGRIANGIITEKLRLGKWQGVVQMMYGGFGKADALYEGDRNELREGIFKSALEHPKSTQFGRETLEALSKAGESDLIFRLATNIPTLNYEDFNAVVSHVDSDYFNDAEQGAQRKQTLHQKAANKAMEEGKYDSAFHHFSEIGDTEGVSQAFDAVLTTEGRYSSGELLERIALSDPSQKDERLKRVVLSSISEEKGLNPLAAFQLYKKHCVDLSSDEIEALRGKVAEKASRYDIERKFANDPEERLLWAKKHTKDEPRLAYSIFRQQKLGGMQVIAAVKAGLSLEMYQNEERALSPSEVSETHLRRAYKSAPFDVKIKIASHLKDSEELRALSRQAHENGKLDTAYRLWVAGEGNLDEGYIDGIRTALIADGIENHFGYMTALDRSDKKGMAEAYDTLMSTDKGRRTDNLRQAYEIALDLRNEERIQRAREEIVAISPEWAIRNFTSQTRGNDERGLDYVLGVVSSQHGIEQGELKRLVQKYQTA